MYSPVIHDQSYFLKLLYDLSPGNDCGIGWLISYFFLLRWDYFRVSRAATSGSMRPVVNGEKIYNTIIARPA